MRLDRSEALHRLAAADHGVLATSGPEGRIDAVPVCFAVVESVVGIPVDRVKPKSSTRLQRVRNLEAHPRATLLCEHWDSDDWSLLWWVRARLVATGVDDRTCARLEEALRDRYPQYRGAAFDGLATLEIDAVAGWAATGP